MPTAVEVLEQAARCQRAGNLAGAERLCREAVRLGPGLAEAHHRLGDVLTELGRTGEAEACYREARRLAPDSAAAARAGPVLVEVSPGELVDKITILEIKSERIRDAAKLTNVRAELAVLRAARAQSLTWSEELEALAGELRAVNEALWEVEDAIRLCERAGDFGPRFVELARSVYRHNDRRAALKRQINDRLGARLVEEKQYTEYQ